MKTLLSILSAILLCVLLDFIVNKSDANPFLQVLGFFTAVFLFIMICLGFYKFYTNIFEDEKRSSDNI